MRNIKSAIIILAALAVIVVAWKAMSKPAATPAQGPAVEGEAVESNEVIVEETVIPQEETAAQAAMEENDNEAAQTDSMSDIQNLFSGCQENADCVPVYPSCCKEAYAPYFVNKQYEAELVKEYKRITGEPQTCPELSKCPRSYFGGAKAACVAGRCLQDIFDKPAFQ